MPDFPLQFRVNTYRTEHGQLVRARRGYVLCEFPGPPIVCDAFVDTAAPFSVVPHTLARPLSWQRLATSLTPVTTAGSAVLSWQGVPCELGTTMVRLIHLGSGVRSGALRLLAKFPLRPLTSSLERDLVIGLSLADDNDVQLFLAGTGGVLSGWLTAP